MGLGLFYRGIKGFWAGGGWNEKRGWSRVFQGSAMIN
jgi:hypothetical protein